MKRIAFLMLLIAAAAYADDPPVGNYWCAVIILAGPPQQPVPPVQPPCIPCKQNAKGSPAYVGTGSYETDATDLTMPTAGLSLTVSRSYESSRPHDGILGVGWTLSLSARLYYASYLFSAPSTYAHEADIVLPDGSHYRFIENTDGTYTPPLSIYDTLTKNGDGSFDLVTADGSVHYHFGLGGRIDTIGDEFGNTLTFTYDTNNRLQQAADGAGSGRYVDVFYGADGRVSTIQDHTGRQIQFAYDPTAGTLTSVTDPIGRKTNYTYQQVRYGAMLTRIADNWGRVITDVTYDANGRVHSYTEEGETYTYTYNYNNNANQTAKVDSMGNQWVYTFTTGGPITDRVYPGGASTHVIYNSDFTIQQSTDETGVITSYTYGPNGRVASVTRDVGGPQTVRYDYTYDPAFPAKVTAITPKSPSTGNYDPNWQATRYDYYQAGSPAPGALVHVYRLHDDGLTSETMATYAYNSHGQVLSAADANGGETDYGYDAANNLITLTTPANNGAGTRPVTTFGYDGVGRRTSVTDALTHVTSYSYDGIDRVKTVTLPKPVVGSPLDFTTTYSYDNFDGVSQLVSTNVTDPNGIVTSTSHDAYGRTAVVTDGLGNATTYQYTRARITSLTDANGNVTTFGYDGLNRLQTTTFPDSAVESLTYTSDGMLNTRTDRNNHVTTYTYNHLKRLTTKSYSGAGSITWTYQGQKLVSVSDTSVTPSETNAWTYDEDFRVASNAQATRGTITYTYSPTDAVSSYSVAGGATATYAYYPDGSLNTIQWSPIAGQFKYTYSATGRYTTVTFPNGQARTYTYDDQERLLQIANTHPTAGNLATYSYGYDMNNADGTMTRLGQRTSMTADVPAQSLSTALTKYYYDPDYQLIRTDYPSTAPFNGEVDSWTYDAIGNRLTSTINGTTTGYTYQRIGTNPKNWQRLLNDGTTAYTCDGNGNSATIGLLTLTWDRENHLVGIGGSGMAAYSFDFGGRRVSSGGQAFVYDGENRIQDVGAPSAQYLFGPMIDEPLAASSSAGAVYYVVDALGSIGLGVDPSGNAQQSYVFDAWGVPRFQAVTAAQPFGYTGREFADAGYQFYRARQYAPILGRFLSEDPLPRLATAATQARAMKPALPRSIFYYPASRRSTYAYVENNAVTSTDPMGLAPCSAETRAACIAGCKAKGRLYLACETVFDCALFELSICYCQYKEPPKPKIGERDCYAELAKCLRFAKDPILGTEDPFKVVLCMAAFRVCMEGK